MSKKTMLALLMALLFAIGATACAGRKDAGKNSSSSNQEPSSSVETQSSFENSDETESSVESSDKAESSSESSGINSSEDSSEETWTGIYKP